MNPNYKMKSVWIVFVFVFLVVSRHHVLGQNTINPQAILRAAEEQYERGLFQHVVKSLESQTVRYSMHTTGDQVDRLALLARAYLALDLPGQAQRTIDALLAIKPDYIPTHPQDHDFQTMVLDTKTQLEKKNRQKRQTRLIAGGTATIAALVWYLWPPPPEKSLPMPPGSPDVY